MSPPRPHIVIIGGSYAGLSALNSIIDPQRDGTTALKSVPTFTILDERDGFYHTVGAPLGQISSRHAEDFWVPFKELQQTKYAESPVQFVQGSAKLLDIRNKSISYVPIDNSHHQNLDYDYLLVATGRRWGQPVVPGSSNFDQYMQEVRGFETKMSACKSIVVVGGGACGVEIAGEMKAHWPDKKLTLIHSGPSVLSREPLSDEFKSTALQLLREQDVEVTLNVRVESDRSDGTARILALSDGRTIECDAVVYSAVQKGSNTKFIPREALDDQGCVQVRKTLQFPSSTPNADSHYAIGDVAAWQCIKRSVPAMVMGRHAGANILTTLKAAEDGTQAELAEIEIAPAGMTLSVGDYAISNRSGVSYGKDLKLRAFGTGLGIDGTLSGLGLRPRQSQAVLA